MSNKDDMADKLDELLFKVLKTGQEYVTSKGEVVNAAPSASMLNVVRQRLRDLGQAQGMPGDRTKSLIANVEGAIASANFPKLSEIEDDAGELKTG